MLLLLLEHSLMRIQMHLETIGSRHYTKSRVFREYYYQNITSSIASLSYLCHEVVEHIDLWRHKSLFVCWSVLFQSLRCVVFPQNLHVKIQTSLTHVILRRTKRTCNNKKESWLVLAHPKEPVTTTYVSTSLWDQKEPVITTYI